MTLRVLYAASEALPYSKTGGLADVAHSLPQAVARLGADVRLVTPAYRGVLEAGPDARRLGNQSYRRRFEDRQALSASLRLRPEGEGHRSLEATLLRDVR